MIVFLFLLIKRENTKNYDFSPQFTWRLWCILYPIDVRVCTMILLCKVQGIKLCKNEKDNNEFYLFINERVLLCMSTNLCWWYLYIVSGIKKREIRSAPREIPSLFIRIGDLLKRFKRFVQRKTNFFLFFRRSYFAPRTWLKSIHIWSKRQFKYSDQH